MLPLGVSFWFVRVLTREQVLLNESASRRSISKVWCFIHSFHWLPCPVDLYWLYVPFMGLPPFPFCEWASENTW